MQIPLWANSNPKLREWDPWKCDCSAPSQHTLYNHARKPATNSLVDSQQPAQNLMRESAGSMDGWTDGNLKYPSTDQSKFYHLEDEIFKKVIKSFHALGWDIGNLHMP